MVEIHREVYCVWVWQLHIPYGFNWLLSNCLLLVRVERLTADFIYFFLVSRWCKNRALKYIEILMVMCIDPLNIWAMAADTGSLLIITIKWKALIILPVEIIDVNRNSSSGLINVILTTLTHFYFQTSEKMYFTNKLNVLLIWFFK